MTGRIHTPETQAEPFEPYTERWYAGNETEGDEVGQGIGHYVIIEYLVGILNWIFRSRGQQVGVVSDVNFYQLENPVSPDIAVVDGLVLRGPERTRKVSYFVGRDGIGPRLVMEISSEKTWDKDFNEKLAKYAQMKIKQYFIFDPNEPPLWQDEWKLKGRLVGWQLDELSGQYVELPKDGRGWLWSEELQSWLVVEDAELRLYTRDGQLRLSEAEAKDQQAKLAEQREAQAQQREAQARLRAELAEQQMVSQAQEAEVNLLRAEAAEQRADAERARAEAQQARAEAERARAAEIEERLEREQRRREAAEQRLQQEFDRAEAERNRSEKLAELLRKLGHNPDELM